MDKKERSVIRETVDASISKMKKVLAGSGVSRAVTDIRREVEETLEDTKKKVSDIADHLSAKMMSFFLVLAGLFLGFGGVSIFIYERTSLSLGTSMMLVGLLVVVLGWFTLKK